MQISTLLMNPFRNTYAQYKIFREFIINSFPKIYIFRTTVAVAVVLYSQYSTATYTFNSMTNNKHVIIVDDETKT